LVDIVLRFGTSPERRRILSGLLKFREALHEVGLDCGFQWMDGSFLEAVEIIEQRPPGDVDVVTFVEPPAEFAVDARVQEILNHDSVKQQYLVDHYFVELTLPSRDLIAQSTYWSGVWSHRRSMQWKGFLQIGLERNEDAAAIKILEEAERQESAE